MQGENRPGVPFDDRAALEELERLQRSIQEYRRRREEAEGKFEEFVGSFQAPSTVSASGSHQAPSGVAAPASQNAPLPGFYTGGSPAAGSAPVTPPPPASSQGVPAPATPAGPAIGPVAAPAGVGAAASSQPIPPVVVANVQPPVATGPAANAAAPVVVPPAPAVPSPAATVAPPAVALPGNLFSDAGPSSAEAPQADAAGPATGKGAARGRLLLAAVAVAAVLIAAVLLMRSRTPPVVLAPPPAAAVEGPAPVPIPPAAAAPVAAAPAAATPVPPAEIRTIRRVWVRAIVDGKREVERELEADARVPLPAGRLFVIRAGDAGAVHFVLNGKDQGPLGAEAQVVTRTFTSPEQ
jgi:hypothetical protein